MAITLKEKMMGLSAGRRKRVKARARQLVAEEMTLQELRRARKITQVRMAKELGISQNGVSRIEKRSDLLLSTLRKTVEAMGGNLSLVAEFPDRKPVVLAGIAVDEQTAPPKGRRNTQLPAWGLRACWRRQRSVQAGGMEEGLSQRFNARSMSLDGR